MQARIYVKPSIIQSFSNANMNVNGLDTIDSLNNNTFGKLEIGGSFDLNNVWSGFAEVSHTIGDDYKDTSLNVGVKYNW